MGTSERGIMKKKRKLRVLAGICAAAMVVTSLPYMAESGSTADNGG